MTLWLVYDEPGGAQGEVLDQAARMEPPLWIEVDREPPQTGLYDYWKELRWESVAAVAARLAHMNVSGKDLVISTLTGFGGEFQRHVKAEDHTPETLQFVTCLRQSSCVPPKQIIIAGLSTSYDRALSRISGTLSKASIPRGVEIIPAIAGSALTHLMWDFQRSKIPVLVSCWTNTVNKKEVPHVPMGVRNVADRTVDAKEFPFDEWERVLNGTSSSSEVK